MRYLRLALPKQAGRARPPYAKGLKRAMYACVCRAVTESEINECIAAGAKSAKQIRDATGAGSDCAICIRRICAMLKRNTELAAAS
ncbi:hypothetical protein GCM10010106_38560 [Thermopolyspora flexuosa]|uniref:Bacterioferritin-associated ferredoxin n=2 Tax=Thermopolyspora flexuosa TaxID=103836 RepID=A0A543J239_9ACTN|nr:bacterioferritin-associated ferredoxin [Thermopolyspora flexuosa]GGM87568.1 hypothetical protein GCM10010106_38560 [Thermopolyspora flexuosa]